MLKLNSELPQLNEVQEESFDEDLEFREESKVSS